MTYRSPLLDLPGAVPGDPPDAGVAAHYGDPLREQRAPALLVDRSHRGVLRVGGADRLSWLHSLTTQHLSALPPMRGAEALVLSPHGHVEHHLVVADDGVAAWLDVEPGTAAGLLAFLERMRFLLRVEPADLTGSYAVLSLLGPSAAGVAGAPPQAYAVAARDGVLVRRMPYGVDVLVPRDHLAAQVERLRAAGASLGGTAALEALRVADRRPRLGRDTDHRTIPHEVGWLATAVHLDKGCYRGQETVARVHNLGRPPRRLVLLHLDGTVVGHGTPVTWEGRQVGAVGTAVVHHELGPVALALVRRTTPDDAVLRAGGVAASIDPAPIDAAPDALGRADGPGAGAPHARPARE
ncbi:MAG TPA: folate-binding protein, partial [Frankiaceae bacterium]|nr:folate-binding protein [Frankiaceae bacterium]